MIVAIGSDLPTFKALRFRRGLNVLVAQMTDASTAGQTRNSAGKSSVVEILHFVLGADVPRTSPFRSPELVGKAFWAVLRIRGIVVKVARYGAAPGRILIDERRARRLGLEMVRDEDTGERYVDVEVWKDYLGHAWFGLPRSRTGTPFGVKRAPTFRMLFGYFARRSRDLGFAHVARYSENLQEADAQVALSYLLGLDWTIPHKIREAKERYSKLGELRRAITEGNFGEIFGTAAEIRPALARVEEAVVKLEKRDARFEVHSQYRELAEEAARLRASVATVTLDLATAKDTLAYLRQTAAEEAPPSYTSVDTLYEAVGIELPGVARRQMEDVARFQASVVENRQAYLREQTAEAAGDVAELEAELSAAGERHAAILLELRGKGALDEFIDLQRELAQARSKRDGLLEKLRNASTLENSSAERKRESAEHELELQKDYDVRAREIGLATRLVDHAIGALYDDREGNLLISPTKNGPSFMVTIGGGGNQGGIDQMKVFCFDMMLYERVSERLGGPRFLVHDSHLFDGVDPRQASSALVLGAEVARRVSGQYVVTMNSDKFEKLDAVAELRPAVLGARLYDTENGGLFGFRFELPQQRR